MKQILLFTISLLLVSCSLRPAIKNESAQSEESTSIILNQVGKGQLITVSFYGGKSLYYPLMAVWLEDSVGNYVQTLFVPHSIATGTFKYGKQVDGKWVEAPKRAPQTLPYWAHKRGVIAPDGLYMPDPQNPVADAYSGATPVTSFVLTTRADKTLKGTIKIMFELNQNWDWNSYWTNNKYPGNENYKMSCQPALVYEAEIEPALYDQVHLLKPIGYSDPLGETGALFSDLSTLTTALHIADSITVKISE
jgi:hypothetical protein